MKKLSMILIVAAISLVLTMPIFADEISQALTDNSTNTTNETINNDTLNNTTNNTTVNSTLSPQQLQTLTDTQGKLTALIATIQGLKATYGTNTKAKGLLNALTQFEKQANKLNSEIAVFKQNPSLSNSNSIDGQINSFVKRTAALEHKVAIKKGLLTKMSSKKAKVTRVKETKKVKVAKKVKTKKHKKNNK